MAIDDVVNNALPNQPDQSPLEKTVKKEESDWSLKNILWDTLTYSPIGIASYLLGGPAAFMTAAGLGIGRWIANKKKKVKTKWKDMRKTLGIGMVGGALAYWAYSIPDYIIGAPVSLAGRIVKTLLFNPLMIAPWMAWYRTTFYIVNKYGGWGFIKSLFNFKIFKYVKEAYHNDLKEKYWPTVKETFLTLAPIHFFSMNYVANPTYRVGIGAGNDVLLSMIAGEEGILKTIKRKLTGKKKDNYNSNIIPYKPAQQYRMAA